MCGRLAVFSIPKAYCSLSLVVQLNGKHIRSQPETFPSIGFGTDDAQTQNGRFLVISFLFVFFFRKEVHFR